MRSPLRRSTPFANESPHAHTDSPPSQKAFFLLPPEPLDSIAPEVSRPGLTVRVEARERSGPQAGIEWLLQTAIITPRRSGPALVCPERYHEVAISSDLSLLSRGGRHFRLLQILQFAGTLETRLQACIYTQINDQVHTIAVAAVCHPMREIEIQIPALARQQL